MTVRNNLNILFIQPFNGIPAGSKCVADMPELDSAQATLVLRESAFGFPVGHKIEGVPILALSVKESDVRRVKDAVAGSN